MSTIRSVSSSVDACGPVPGYWHSFSASTSPSPSSASPADGADEGLKQLVAGDEIGLGIDLDDGAGRTAASPTPTKPSAATRPAFFAAADKPLLAQPIDRGFYFAAVFAERPLAVHHPGAGLLAQFLDQRRRYLGHRIILS